MPSFIRTGNLVGESLSANLVGGTCSTLTSLPKSPDFFEAGLRSVSGQLLELLGATYSWTGKANSQFDQESLESSLSFPKFRLARFFFSTNLNSNFFYFQLSRVVRIMQISQENGQKPDKTEHETEKSARDRKECTKAGDLIARRVKSQLQSTLGQPKSTH
ncbi:hypothetical protein Tco_1513209 [Tanacetum coccineum]